MLPQLQNTEEGLLMNNIISKNSLIGFIMAGDPDLETTKKCIIAMDDAGADMVELGIPFSDPIAESKVIQSANIRALKSGTHLTNIFLMLEQARKSTDIPIICHSYINPIFNYGYEPFFEMCKKVKVTGVVVPDLPYEEKSEIKEYADKYGVHIISFVVPASKERIQKISQNASGFIYFVPSISSTAMMGDSSSEIDKIVEIIKEVKDIPVALGFGINTASQAEYFSKKADGVIIGNAIVKIIEKYSKTSPGYVYNYVKEMKNAIIRR